ncbi:MAG TPA: transposase family protein [Streptosporangiaceae bacterium]
MRYYRTTGLELTQMQELVRRIHGTLAKPWKKQTGKPKSCGLYQATEMACMYLRHNVTQEFIADMRNVSQPTVSRIVTVLVPIVKSVLAEFVPSAEDAIEVVKGRVCLVDGTITPCWSYAGHDELWSRKQGTTGFNTQFICLLDGHPSIFPIRFPGAPRT